MEKQTDKLRGLTAITESAGWFLPHEKLCWISERTSCVKQDTRNRLHCENGPAVAYPDGWEIYAWHGVRVPKQIIVAPEKLKWSDIQNEKNQEIRQVMIQRVGAARLLAEAQAKQDHTDDFGTLYSIPSADRKVVKVINCTPEPDGSFKDYFLFVPPDMQRAKQAVAWTFGQKEEDYRPAVQT